MPDLRYGRIVLVEMFDLQERNPKVRPAVIISPTDDVAKSGLIRVVAITTLFDEAFADVSVPIPWQFRNGHP